jgi:hypothetical protein
MCLPRGFASARPMIARLFASVPPEVKNTSPGRAPSAAATLLRASSTIVRARCPAACTLDGFAAPASSASISAARASARSGAVAAASRYRWDP